MRDVDGGEAEALLQRLDLVAQLHAHLGVEVRQRLVEQQQLRVDGERAAERHALALAAGELRDLALLEAREVEELQHLADPPPRPRAAARRAGAGRSRCCRAPSCAATARRTGTPSRCRASPAAGSRCRGRRAGSRRPRTSGSRRWCAAAWSCRSPTSRGSPRTRPARRQGRCHAAPASRRSRRGGSGPRSQGCRSSRPALPECVLRGSLRSHLSMRGWEFAINTTLLMLRCEAVRPSLEARTLRLQAGVSDRVLRDEPWPVHRAAWRAKASDPTRPGSELPSWPGSSP